METSVLYHLPISVKEFVFPCQVSLSFFSSIDTLCPLLLKLSLSERFSGRSPEALTVVAYPVHSFRFCRCRSRWDREGPAIRVRRQVIKGEEQRVPADSDWYNAGNKRGCVVRR